VGSAASQWTATETVCGSGSVPSLKITRPFTQAVALMYVECPGPIAPEYFTPLPAGAFARKFTISGDW
jgi:hypothetical protein